MDLSALCVGQASVEMVGAMPRFPSQLGAQQELSAFTLQGGGAAATAAVALARLGVRTSFGGVLPDDFFGDFASASLFDAEVDLRFLKRSQGGVSPVAFSALDEERGRRTVFWTRGDCEPLRCGDVPLTALTGQHLLLVDGAFPEAQLELLHAARQAGIRTALSVHAMGPQLRELTSACDAVLASERFARELAADVPRALRELLALGPKCAVICLGAEGAAAQEEGGAVVRSPAHPVQVVDPTGAGDVFRGAFCFAWMRGLPMGERLRLANAAAALKCESYGPREGVPDLSAVHAALGI